MADKKKQDGVLDAYRNMEEQQRKMQEEQDARRREQEEQERKAYEEQLRQERLELIRLKQGVITESETIHEEHETPPKYTIWQKISNFFYHNKWWMGIAAFFVFLTGFLVWQVVTTVHADMIVLLLVDDDLLNATSNAQISEVFEQYIDDVNGDGKVVVDVYYIPASDESADKSGYTGDSTKLFAEFQIAEACIVISDERADQFIVPDHTLYNLEEDFGEYAQTEEMRFYLADTDFAKDIGWTEQPLGKDVYIGIRSVRETLESEAKMQKTFDISYPVLGKFIAHYGTPETAEPATEQP